MTYLPHSHSYPSSNSNVFITRLPFLFMLMSLEPTAKERKETQELLAYCASKERVKGVQPVIHVFVVENIPKDPTVLGAHSKGVWCLKETQENKNVPMDTEHGDHRPHSEGTRPFTPGGSRDTKHKRDCVPHDRVQNSSRQAVNGNGGGEGRFRPSPWPAGPAILHLGCGQVNDARSTGSLLSLL